VLTFVSVWASMRHRGSDRGCEVLGETISALSPDEMARVDRHLVPRVKFCLAESIRSQSCWNEGEHMCQTEFFVLLLHAMKSDRRESEVEGCCVSFCILCVQAPPAFELAGYLFANLHETRSLRHWFRTGGMPRRSLVHVLLP
jgi:hypothetical protein